MAAREMLFDVLKRYGIEEEDTQRIEIKKDVLEILLYDKRIIKIKDPAIVSLAKFSTLNFEEAHRGYLLSTLFSYERIRRGIKNPLEFYEEMMEKPLDYLKEILTEAERNINPRRFREYIIIDICSRIKEISKEIPTGIDRELEKLPLHQLIDMHNYIYSINEINHIDVSDGVITYWI